MENNVNKTPEKKLGIGYAIPFLVALGILTVISFIIPLRPTVSYEEKRKLAEFPEFSVSALASGDYFDGITTWFSDTFPGRQRWVDVSDQMKSLYGYSEITIEGSLDTVGDSIPVSMEVPPEAGQSAPEPQMPPETPSEPEQTEPAAQTEPEETEPEETEPEPTGWGGVDAGVMEINLGTAIQIGDSGFNQLGFSKYESDNYIKTLSDFATKMKDKGVRVISSPAPTAVGVMVEEKYLERLNCVPQDDMIDYLHSNMNEDVVTVDMFSRLVSRNDEYIYFRTDHHWTALGAYYGYVAFCEDTNQTPAPLENFEVWDMGRFPGGLYGKVAKPARLREDNLVAYIPPGDITLNAIGEYYVNEDLPILRDMSLEPDGAKYSTFCSGDHRMAEIINESIPDAPNCVLIKDSFGSPFSIFLTQNYHKVYSLDYRKFNTMNMSQFVEEYDIDDVIVAPYLIATQSWQGNAYFGRLCS